jgi:hypothetical protein
VQNTLRKLPRWDVTGHLLKGIRGDVDAVVVPPDRLRRDPELGTKIMDDIGDPLATPEAEKGGEAAMRDVVTVKRRA